MSNSNFPSLATFFGVVGFINTAGDGRDRLLHPAATVSSRI